MSRKGKVIVAMSGGVDSSVTACLLKEQGYDCVGVFMCVGVARARGVHGVGEAAESPRRLKHGCCSPVDAADARTIAGKLGIPFHVLNFEAEFDRIIDYFVDEYARARTPNPCIRCNTDVKFGRLLEHAARVDAEYVATGHYARIVERDGRPHLARSRNVAKDQSYVLFGIRRDNLARCLFPLGEMADKAEVRRLAASLGLRVHDKPDSQEICFVPDDDYAALVRARRPEALRPGAVRDEAGNVLGEHAGIVHYTVGQRRGLGIAMGQPVYVTRLNVLDHSVTVGPRAALLADALVAEQVHWLADPPAVGEELSAAIKIRHQHTPAPGFIRVQPDGRVAARFADPQSAVTPGQAAVFYDEEGVVLGGGWIQAGTAARDFSPGPAE